MSFTINRISPGRVGAIGIILFLLLGAFDEKNIECEEAIAHLQDCCDDLDARYVCESGCVGTTLPLKESNCIQDRTCSELISAGVCERVTQLSRDAPSDGEPHQEVCP
jgi:hypothetical protein